MKKSAYTIGVEAEKTVAAYYESNGYEVLFFRYKTKFGEIDIIGKNNNLIAFIEVKARNNPLHLELLPKAQIKRNCNAALVFISENPQYDTCDLRFDYAEMINGKLSPVIENAWVCEE